MTFGCSTTRLTFSKRLDQGSAIVGGTASLGRCFLHLPYNKKQPEWQCSSSLANNPWLCSCSGTFIRLNTRSSAVAERPRGAPCRMKICYVTQGHWKWYHSIAYEFLLAFRSNYGPVVYNFRDKARNRSKIAIFSIQYLQSTPPLGASVTIVL